MKTPIFQIPKQKGVIVLTGAIESLSGNPEDYTLVISRAFAENKYSVMAHRGTSETAICVCDNRQTASNIIDQLTFKNI